MTLVGTPSSPPYFNLNDEQDNILRISFFGIGSVLQRGPARSFAEDDKIDFSRQVLPILSNKCFVCHGPDSEKESELRLDTFSAATQDLGGYKAIDVEHPEKSQLLQRIHDKDDPMPPEDAEKQLNDEERKILSAWVKQGGKYFKHWAYVAPKKTSPKSSSATVGSDVIDGFVRDQLALRVVKISEARRQRNFSSPNGVDADRLTPGTKHPSDFSERLKRKSI